MNLLNRTGKDTNKSANSFYAVKRSRKSVSLEIKHKIIYLADSGESNTEIARKLELPRTTVVTILKDKARILETIRCQIPMQTKYIPRQGKRDCVMEL
jgi:DNA-binding NarL/FixJ family response regulator